MGYWDQKNKIRGNHAFSGTVKLRYPKNAIYCHIFEFFLVYYFVALIIIYLKNV